MKFVAFNGSPSGKASATGRIIEAFLAALGRKPIAITFASTILRNVAAVSPAGSVPRGTVCCRTICRNYCAPTKQQMLSALVRPSILGT